MLSCPLLRYRFLVLATYCVMSSESFDIHHSTRNIGGRYGALEMQESSTKTAMMSASVSVLGEQEWATSAVSRVHDTRFRMLLAFTDSLLRGAGQVVFQNSPTSGICVLAALFVQSKWIASLGLLGLVSSTLAAISLDFGGEPLATGNTQIKSKIKDGLFGFNGLLCGLAMATFHRVPWDFTVILPCVFVASMSSVLVEAFSNSLPDGVPSLTLPFNLATATYLLCAKGASSGLTPTCFQPPDPTTASSVAAAASSTTRLLGEGILRGFGQVFLADGLLPSVLVLVAMVLGHDFSSSEQSPRSKLRFAPKVAFAAIGGSFLGTLVAASPSLMGTSPAVASLGLWSYNALLGAAALSGGVTEAPLALSALCAVSCALVGGAMASALAPLSGLPFLTFPFCIATMPFLFVRARARNAGQ
jgi:urea transporter